MAAVPAAIDTHDLSKRYGRLDALIDLSIQIDEGEIFGFLGPNGAGKTTTIRLLLGLLTPSRGRALVLGHEVAGPDASWRREVGYLPGELALWPTFSGQETVELLARLTGRPALWRAELVDCLKLSAADLKRPVAAYSDGMKQKLGIVQALQCAPRLVLLDEPTKGLDPLIQDAFYDLVRKLPGRGTTIFFSSHVLPEVERVCDRVGMLRRGRLVNLGSVRELRQSLPRRVTMVFADDVDPSIVNAFGDVRILGPRRVELHVAAGQVRALVARAASLPLEDLLIEAPSLEDAFRELYR